jgi:hypothetical protein
MKSRVLQILLGVLVAASLAMTIFAVGDDYETERDQSMSAR